MLSEGTHTVLWVLIDERNRRYGLVADLSSMRSANVSAVVGIADFDCAHSPGHLVGGDGAH